MCDAGNLPSSGCVSPKGINKCRHVETGLRVRHKGVIVSIKCSVKGELPIGWSPLRVAITAEQLCSLRRAKDNQHEAEEARHQAAAADETTANQKVGRLMQELEDVDKEVAMEVAMELEKLRADETIINSNDIDLRLA